MEKIIIPITPQTWIRIVSGKRGSQLLFAVPEECTFRHKVTESEDDRGLPCDDYITQGHCKHTLSPDGRRRKRRIERYNKYRMDLFHLVKQMGFQLPTCGWAIYFYIPIPKRWPKHKKISMHGQLHLQKPDTSNLIKAFEDALTGADQSIAQRSGDGKFWVNQEQGYIEILLDQPLYNPFGVDLSAGVGAISMEDILAQREARKARRDTLKAAREKEKQKDLPRRNPKPLKLISQEKLFKKEEKIK